MLWKKLSRTRFWTPSLAESFWTTSFLWFAGATLESCDIVGLLQESKRPLPRKLRKKSEKGFPRPLGPGVEKAKKKSKKSRKRAENPKKNLKNNHFRVFFGFFWPCPDLPFLAFFGKSKENHPKKQGFFSLPNPLNPWERSEKCSKKQGNSLQRKKQGNRKKQGKEDQGGAERLREPLFRFFFGVF